jgi:PAS domain S-box-containing protein
MWLNACELLPGAFFRLCRMEISMTEKTKDAIKSQSKMPNKTTARVVRRGVLGNTAEGVQKTKGVETHLPLHARIAPPPIKTNPTQAEYFKDIVAIIREPLLVLDKDLRVLSANHSFYKLFRVKHNETLGNLIYDLGNGQWDIPALRLLLETILPQKAVFNDYKVEHDFPSIGRRILLLNARRIPPQPKKAQWILLALEDITLRMQLERTLQASEQRFRTVFETAHDRMLLVDKTSGKILNSNQAAQDAFDYSNSELLKKNLWELNILKDHQQFEQVFLELEKRGFVELLNKTIQTRQGGHFPADITMMDRAAVIQCNIRDITEHKEVDEALRASKEMLQTTFDATVDGITVLDSDRKIIFCNKSTVGIHGYSSIEQLIGKRFIELVAEEDHQHVMEGMMDVLRIGMVRDVQVSGLKCNGKKFPAELSVSLIRDNAGMPRGFVGFTRDITERVRAMEDLKQSHEQLRALNIYWQDAFEAERTYISREIHDQFGQSMTALKIDLTWLARRLPEGDDKIKRIEGMNTLVDDSIALMRQIATELRPNLLDELGLNAALEWQRREFSRRNEILCKLELPEQDLGLNPALSISLLRIFQETLTNVSRHAQATRVDASLRQEDQTVILSVHDNGRGITKRELIDPGALGLVGLRERTTQWGGKMTIDGEAGKGTTITVRIPLPVLSAQGGQP